MMWVRGYSARKLVSWESPISNLSLETFFCRWIFPLIGKWRGHRLAALWLVQTARYIGVLCRTKAHDRLTTNWKPFVSAYVIVLICDPWRKFDQQRYTKFAINTYCLQILSATFYFKQSNMFYVFCRAAERLICLIALLKALIFNA